MIFNKAEIIFISVYVLLFISLYCYGEEEFFEPFGFTIENESGMKMKICWDAPHQNLVFRLFKNNEEYYEGMVALYRIHEGEIVP